MSKQQNSGIDYSKWDKIELSDSDSEDVTSTNRPVVTRLDQPTSVTFGGNKKGEAALAPSKTETALSLQKEKKGYGLNYSKWDKMDYGDDTESDDGVDREDDVGSSRRSTAEADTNVGADNGTMAMSGISDVNEAASLRKALIKTIGTVNREFQNSTQPVTDTSPGPFDSKKVRLLTSNGGMFHSSPSSSSSSSSPDECAAYWSQDRYEVILSVAFNPAVVSTRDIRVRTSGALDYKDRECASGSGTGESPEDKGSLVVFTEGTNGSEVMMKGSLPHFIYLPEGEEEVDWEIDVATNPNRGLVRVTLLKAVPMQGLTIWWSRPLLHFPEIDVEADIKGRSGASGGTNKNDTQAEKVKQAWDEAHRMFREKVKNRVKEVVHV